MKTNSNGLSQDSNTRLLAGQMRVMLISTLSMAWNAALVYIFCLGWIWQLQHKTVASSTQPNLIISCTYADPHLS